MGYKKCFCFVIQDLVNTIQRTEQQALRLKVYDKRSNFSTRKFLWVKVFSLTVQRILNLSDIPQIKAMNTTIDVCHSDYFFIDNLLNFETCKKISNEFKKRKSTGSY